MQLITTLLVLLFGITAAVIITRQITVPLRETLAAVDRIASGDLTQNLRVTRRDELACCNKVLHAWARPCAS